MKKVLAVAVILCFAATGFAAWWANKSETEQTKTETKADTKTAAKDTTKQQESALIIMTGKITSLNQPQNEIVVKDDKTTYDKVLIVDPDAYKSIKLGDMVEVKMKTGSNVVDSIKVTKAAPVVKPVVTKPVTPKKK